jgi:hypothetical protein
VSCSANTIRNTVRLAFGAWLGLTVLVVAGCGKGAGGGCALGGTCGGNPIGTWQATASCAFPVNNKPAQNAAPPETGVPAPAATSGSWCWDLSFDSSGAVNSQNGQAFNTIPTIALLNPNPDTVMSGTVSFNADGTYLYNLSASGTTQFQLARACLGVNAANLTCGELAVKLFAAVDPTKYSNFQCVDAPDGSAACNCSFDYAEPGMVGDSGRWVLNGSNQIIHYSITGGGNLFQTTHTVRAADFCVTDNGQTLELTGSNGTPLVLKPGLRTLTLTKIAATTADAATGGNLDAGTVADAPSDADSATD